MTKSSINKDVLRIAKAIVAENKKSNPTEDQPLLPVVELYYPRHGRGSLTQRFVRVMEMNDTHLKGFEIASEFDEKPGKPRTYCLDKTPLLYGVRLLHLSKPTK
jgi:hypothetical protein